MEIKVGDCVQLETGERGTVAHIVRLTAYVNLEGGATGHLVAMLLSRLTKIEKPPQPGEPPAQHS
jgi:hypothetical protein